MRRRPSPEVAAALALAACVLAAFAPALLGPRVFFERDVLAYWYPHMTVLRQALAERSWPLWNPWVGFGAPFLADGSFQLAYPPTWLALLLPLAVQFKLIAVGHCLLAAAGACALARGLGLGWRGAAAAGGAYGLSGPLLSAINLFHHYAGAAWMPWLLWALVALLQRPGKASALRLGVLGGVQVLAASGDLLLCAGLLGLLLAAWQLARSRPNARTGTATAAALLLAGSLALAIGAVQWLPTAERAVSGFRARQDARTSTYWSLHPASLVDLAVPRLVVDLPLAPRWRERLFEGREPLLSCLYLGVVALGLAVLALALGPGPAAPAAAGLAFFLAASLGRHTPLYDVLLAVPGFGLLRYPQKFLLPAALCLALLAGAGAHAWGCEWSGAQRRRARLAAASLAVLAVALVLPWWRGQQLHVALLGSPADAPGAAHAVALKLARSSALLLLAAGLVWSRSQRPLAPRRGLNAALIAGALDLVAVAHGTLELAPARLAAHRPAVLGRAGVQPGARVYAAAESPACLVLAGPPRGWSPQWRAALAFQDALRPPTGARWGVFGSFDGEFTGLGSPWAAALTRVVHEDLASPSAQRLLRLAGVDRVVRVGREPVPGLVQQDSLETTYACPLQVLQVPEPMPRAWLVHEARAAAGIDATLTTLLDPAFDPAREVVLESAAAGGGGAGSEAPRPAGRDAVRWLSRGLDELQLSAQLSSPGWLVVSEAFDPGWQATVDGRPASVHRADAAFRALRLDAGPHRVRFTYRPWSARAGAALTLAGVLAAAVLGLVRRSPVPGGIAAAGGGR